MLSPKLEWWHGNQDKKVEVSDSFKNANATGTRKPLKVENFGIAATPEKYTHIYIHVVLLIAKYARSVKHLIF